MGTAGSLQPRSVKSQQFINALAAVRDEDTTTHYVPLEFPAVASPEFVAAIIQAASNLRISNQLHTGIVHCKSSLYAREYGKGPRADDNNAYRELLARIGVLATEMETATLFIQTTFYNYQLRKKNTALQQQVLAGAILTIIDLAEGGGEAARNSSAIQTSIRLALESVRLLAMPLSGQQY